MEEPGRLQSSMVAKSQIATETDFTFTFPLAIGKGNGSHLSILAWKIRDEGSLSGHCLIGSHRVGSDWAT